MLTGHDVAAEFQERDEVSGGVASLSDHFEVVQGEHVDREAGRQELRNLRRRIEGLPIVLRERYQTDVVRVLAGANGSVP